MTASEAASAYVTEIDYPAGFYANQAPVHLAFVCALNGVRAPDPAGAYRYCELGAGAGKTLAILAAANPDAEFLGIDINPAHVAAAQSMAAAGELSNATFLVADVAGGEVASLPQFDFITMHGLYGWVSDAVRQAIRQFIAAKLRPGGLVYVTYNTLPGWGAAGELRRYFQDRSRHLEGEVTAKVAKILDELEMLRREGAPFFQANPSAADVLTRLRGADPRYVTHEFLGPDWHALPFAQVEAEMAEIGLAFAADAQVAENLPEQVLPDALARHVRRQDGRVAQEVAKDFVCNRFFRSDVYIRPDGDAPPATPDALADVLLGLEKTPSELHAKVGDGGGALELADEAARQLIDQLAPGPLSLAEIRSRPELSTGDPGRLLDSVVQLSAARRLLPFARRASLDCSPLPDRIRCRPALNRQLLEAADRPGHSVVLASPVAGTGIAIAPLEACLLLALEGDDPVSAAVDLLAQRGLQLNEGGRVISDPQAARAAIAEILPSFVSAKLPTLIGLGIVAPAGG